MAEKSPASPWLTMGDLVNYWDQAQPPEQNFTPEQAGPPVSFAGPAPTAQAQPAINQQNQIAQNAPSAPTAQDKVIQTQKPANMEAINRVIAQMGSSSARGHDAMKAIIDRVNNYRNNLPHGLSGTDLSGGLALADAWGTNKSNLAGSYNRPNTALELDQIISKQQGDLNKEDLSALKDRLSGEVAKLHYGATKDSINAQRAADNEEKDATALMKFYDTERSGGRMTPIGKAQSNVYQAERIQQLLNQYQEDPNKMPLEGPSSLSEIAIGLNTLLSATGGSEESRKSLIPKSARGNFSTVEQYIMNRPTGAGMEEFVKNAADTLKRERETNQRQVDNYKKRVNAATGGGRLAKSNPERYQAITDAYLSPPEAMQATTAPASSGGGEIKTRSLPDGSKVKVQKQPDGSWIEIH